MVAQITALEREAINGLVAGDYPVERALLIVGGCETEDDVAAYEKKLDVLLDRAESFLSGKGTPVERARGLFDFLWEGRENRYGKVYHSLPESIDRQLQGEDVNVGVCLTLTSLYSVLAGRLGLDVGAGVETPKGGFEGRHDPHILTTLRGDETVYIENAIKGGFDTDLNVGVAYGIKEFEDCPLVALVGITLINRSVSKEEAGDSEGALCDLDSAVAVWDHAHSRSTRGEERMKRNDYEGAVVDFKRAIELSPNRPSTLYNCILGLNALGRQDEALEYIERLLPLKDEVVISTNMFLDSYRIRASIRANRGDFTGAIEDCNEMDAIMIGNPETYRFRGNIYLRSGDASPAEIDFTRAIEVDGSGLNYFQRARARNALENYQGVIDDCTAAISDGFNRHVVYQLRGDAYTALGQTTLAEADYSQARALRAE